VVCMTRAITNLAEAFLTCLLRPVVCSLSAVCLETFPLVLHQGLCRAAWLRGRGEAGTCFMLCQPLSLPLFLFLLAMRNFRKSHKSKNPLFSGKLQVSETVS